MEVVVAVQSGTLLHALRVQLKRRVSARRGGDYNEVPQAIQKKIILEEDHFGAFGNCLLLLLRFFFLNRISGISRGRGLLMMI